MQLAKTLKSLGFSVLVASTVFMLGGCRKEGTAEKVGERADEIADNIKDGDAPLHKKGPIEKTGEAIDDAVADVKKK